MNKDEALEVIKNSFHHLIFEENIKVGNIEVLLYFPSLGLAIMEPDRDRMQALNNENVENMDEFILKRELSAKPLYLDLEEKDFNIGYVINDILLEARFAPSDNFFQSRGAY